MIAEGRFPILGDGMQMRSMAYVDNLARAALAATAPRANGEAYWIADERPYAIAEIVDTVRSVLEDDFGTPARRASCGCRQRSARWRG
jgi:nucleoside-diphosphate-sugar epimerase